MTIQERTQAMLMMYGEVCSRSEAARMLRKDSRTINAMLADGLNRSTIERSDLNAEKILR